MSPIFKTIVVLGSVIAIVSCSNKLKKVDTGPEGAQPKLTRPDVRKVWVPDQIHDNVYEMGHWQYVIDKQSVWSKKD